MKKIKRSLFRTFLDTTPAGETPTYNLLGVNVSELSVDYAPQSESSVDIVSDSADTEITSYQPTAGVSASRRRMIRCSNSLTASGVPARCLTMHAQAS